MKEDKKHTCKYCKRSFHSGKSLGGHMRSHLSTSTSLLEKQELEDGALCLVLMSRERGFGAFLGEEEELSLRKRVRSQLGSDQTKISSFLSCKKSRNGVGSIIDKGRFYCTSCDKSFDSHQALGGHRASHNKNKSTVAVDNYDEGEVMKVKKKIITTKRFECSICLRVFPSGQALGGHKRSHLVANRVDVEDSSSVTNGQAGSSTRLVQRDLENEVVSGRRPEVAESILA